MPCLSEPFDERCNGSDPDLDIQSFAKGIACGQMTVIVAAAPPDPVNHQLRLSKAQIAAPLVHAFMGTFESKGVAIKYL